MNVLFNLIVVVQVVSALAIIGLVLRPARQGRRHGRRLRFRRFRQPVRRQRFVELPVEVDRRRRAVFFASTLTLAYFGSNRPHAAASAAA
jgi:preprotein translocase subunit SecG